MIKINLMKNRVPAVDAGTGLGSTEGVSSLQNNDLREGIIKVALLSVFIAGLAVYESSNIKSLNAQTGALAAQISKLQAEAKAKADEVEGVKGIESQAKELEDKLKVLKLLSQLRLRAVKTLDFMQSSIPEKVWVRHVIYDSNVDHIDQGRFTFDGDTMTTEDLVEFVKRMDNSHYLTDVIIVKNQEVTQNKTLLREYEFTAEVENKN